ncbi:translation elongation factor Ts [Ichthyobacterium seriolicida]|uniref:Elongation factor Ts n=1 Tax=Ichthyobacterium seriolicida TaxID=242600 RepID=A0A1J1DZN6_9FLAO|nr:translation elongation factor Ts [Ichthyobacterium seriolicida]BAV95383.1 translation elongation factor Ts [Ichthyobacterium seriolicida]
MSKVTATEVNNLRKITGSGMMDCKRALVKADGDFDKAIEILRKEGQKIAAKRSDRNSSEGVVLAKVNDDGNIGVLISLNCETDFVAKNENFIKLADSFVDLALKSDVSSKEEFLKASYEGISVEEEISKQIGVIGEKIEIGTFDKITSPFVGHYIHTGNKIASLVSFSEKTQGIESVGKDVAMQIAAMNPLALDEGDISKETIEKELEIIKEQLRGEGKPEDILEGISKGKLNKFFKDNTLVNQIFIKDKDLTVGDYVKKHNPNLKLTSFKRSAIGE